MIASIRTHASIYDVQTRQLIHINPRFILRGHRGALIVI